MIPDLSTLVLIFSAGAMTLLSPCAFPLFPGYISYYIGTNASTEKAFRTGLVCTSGLLSVFSIVGTIVAALGSFISRHIPLIELISGMVLISMGIVLLAEIRLPVFLGALSKLKAPKRRGLAGIFSYGVVYGMATFGCSAPVLFSMIFYAITTGGPIYALATFIIYASGMGIPIILTTILLAKTKKIILQRIIMFTPWFQKISGFILILIGVYIIYFYIIFLR